MINKKFAKARLSKLEKSMEKTDKEHTWIIEEVDGGHVGVGDFWLCSDCGASGGPALLSSKDTPQGWIFLAGTGLNLPKDCGKAKRMIEEYKTMENAELKIFDNRGNLNEYGKSSFENLEEEIKYQLSFAKSEQEVRIISSLLTKLVGDLVSYKIQEMIEASDNKY